jgi:hemerythrin-like domain-containing protein
MTTTTQIQTQPTPDTVTDFTLTYRAVHRALRGGAHRLHRAASEPRDEARIKAIATYWKGYAAEVLAHHSVEDDIFFPALVERVPCAPELIARIDDDHHRLDELMALVTAEVAGVQHGAGQQALARALGELAELMDEHLDFEDEDIVPLFARHFSEAEYREIEGKATRATGKSSQAAFAVPFIASAFTEDERPQALAATPLPVRVIYRLFRGRYARQEAALEGRKP